jgi:hypothetical protein
MTDPYALSSQQQAGVIASDAASRYKHFVARAADFGQVWGLRNSDGWFSFGTDECPHVFPVWPHPAYAMACANGPWAGAEASAIEVHTFLNTWLPNLEAEGTGVAVLPTPELRAAVVPAAQLREDLSIELARIE